MERAACSALSSRCQILRGPERPPEDGCDVAIRRSRDADLVGIFRPPHEPDGCPYRSHAVSLAERLPDRRPNLPRVAGGMRALARGDGSDAIQGVIDAVLATRHAGTRKLRLSYELVGPAGAPVVFVAGGISAHRHLAAHAGDRSPGWAQDLLGKGRKLHDKRQEERRKQDIKDAKKAIARY